MFHSRIRCLGTPKTKNQYSQNKKCHNITASTNNLLQLAVVALGGGRTKETDLVNPAVGLSDVVRLGDYVKRGQPLTVVHASRSDQADAAARAVLEAITLDEKAPDVPELIIERVG